MIKIVTGKINSLKTTRLKDYFNQHHKGDGFLAIKHMEGDLVHHYDLYQLSSGKTMPYVYRKSFLDHDHDIRHQVGPYCFLESAYIYLEDQIDQMISHHVSPIYLDEIGLLELDGLGLANVLEKCLALNIDMCLTIRSDLLNDVIKKFNIKSYEYI